MSIQAGGQVDPLQARRSIQPACRFNSEECARGPEAGYGATARSSAAQPRLLRAEESGSTVRSAGAIFAGLGGHSWKFWGGKRESNPQPSEPQSGALPVELFPPPARL